MKLFSIILDWLGVMLSTSALYSVYLSYRETMKVKREMQERFKRDRERIELLSICSEIESGTHRWIHIRPESPDGN